MKILYIAQFHETSGYAHAARGYLESIHNELENTKDEKIDFKILSVSYDKKSFLKDCYENKLEKNHLQLIQKYHINLIN